jgi:hypothetical protein
MNKKLSKPPTPSKGLTVSERRAFIWASPRIHSKSVPGPYNLCSRCPTEEEPLTDADMTIERSGVKAAFDYLYGHANIERTEHGFWAVGHLADDTRLVFDDMHEASGYAEHLRQLYLAADSGLCIGCGADLEEATGEPEPKLVPPSSRTH